MFLRHEISIDILENCISVVSERDEYNFIIFLTSTFSL